MEVPFNGVDKQQPRDPDRNYKLFKLFKAYRPLKLRACGSVCNKIIFEKGVSSVVFLIYKFSALYNPLVNHLLIIFKARSMIQLFKTFVEYLLIPKMSPETVLNKLLSNMHC